MRPSSFQVDCPWRTKVTLLGVDTLGNAQTAPRHPRARDAECRDEDSSKRFRREATYETRAGATVCRATDIALGVARYRWTTTDGVPNKSRRTPCVARTVERFFRQRGVVGLLHSNSSKNCYTSPQRETRRRNVP
jgi:ribosomal protein S25